MSFVRVATSIKKPKLSKSEFRKHSRVSPETVVRRFGNWRKALQKAGVDKQVDASTQSISRYDALAELKRVAPLVKAPRLSTREFSKKSPVSAKRILRHFGSSQEALQAAGLGDRFDPSTQRVSSDQILAELTRIAALVEKPTLNRSDFKTHSRISLGCINRHFGNWQKALQAAGLGDRFDSSSQPISRETVLAEIKRVSEELDVRVLGTDEFDSRAVSANTLSGGFSDHGTRL